MLTKADSWSHKICSNGRPRDFSRVTRLCCKIPLDLIPLFGTNIPLNNRHRSTLSEIFKNPVPASIKWADIEALLIALDAEISEGSGSRVRIALNGVRAVFHRPHPQPATDKGAVKSMRRFLTEAGIKP